MAKKVERTAPGSKNDYRITYDTGIQKWTDDKPGDGKGDSSGSMLRETLGEPAVKRGLAAISKAIESGNGLAVAVKGLVRDIGTEKGTTVLSAVRREMKKRKAPGNIVSGWEKATDMVKAKKASRSVKGDADRVIKRIHRTVRNPDLADEMVEHVKTYDKTHNDRDDLPSQEQRFLYGPEDFGEVKPLTKKRKVDIGWTDHAEYRSELRDVDPKEVNQAIVDKMMKKLNPPQRGNQRFKEPGLGTFVVDYNTQKNPAEADVITVWAKEKNMNASVVKELQAVASALVAAEAMRPVTASEMDVYCSDCARQIEAGEMVVTRGELRELLAGYRKADEKSDTLKTLNDYLSKAKRMLADLDGDEFMKSKSPKLLAESKKSLEKNIKTLEEAVKKLKQAKSRKA
jgi:hypothetical protein